MKPRASCTIDCTRELESPVSGVSWRSCSFCPLALCVASASSAAAIEADRASLLIDEEQRGMTDVAPAAARGADRRGFIGGVRASLNDASSNFVQRRETERA